MAYSYFKYTGDGSTTTYAIPFALGFLKPEDITVRVGDEKDSAGNPVYRTWSFLPGNQGMIKIDGPVPVAGEPVVIERTVSKTKLVHDFQKGEPLDEKSLDESHEQLMMAIHELLDGRDITFLDSLDVYGDINMHGNTIRNVKPDPADESSVATLELVKNYGNGGAVVQEITPFTTLPGVKKYYVGDDVLLDPNANNLLLVLDGVTQEPNVSYIIVDKKYIEFTAMPPEGVRCWGVASMLFSSPQIRAVVEREVSATIGTAQFRVPGSVVGRNLEARFGDFKNVMDYGAIGDGVVDDTDAFIAAANSGELIFVPRGNYKLSKRVLGSFVSTGHVDTGGFARVVDANMLRALHFEPSLSLRMAFTIKVPTAPDGERYYLQGFASDGDDIVFIGMRTASHSYQKVTRYKLSTGESVAAEFQDLWHVNSIAYCDGRLYVTPMNAALPGVVVLNAETLVMEQSFTPDKSTGIGYALTYDDYADKFYYTASDNKVFVYSSDWQYERVISLNIPSWVPTVGQGVCAYKSLLFYPRTSPSSNPSQQRRESVVVYDPANERSLYSWDIGASFGEIESVAFIKGRMLVGFNDGAAEIPFYVAEFDRASEPQAALPTDSFDLLREGTVMEPIQDFVTMYCDASQQFAGNGSPDKPFNSLRRALWYAKNVKGNYRVLLNLTGDFADGNAIMLQDFRYIELSPWSGREVPTLPPIIIVDSTARVNAVGIKGSTMYLGESVQFFAENSFVDLRSPIFMSPGEVAIDAYVRTLRGTLVATGADFSNTSDNIPTSAYVLVFGGGTLTLLGDASAFKFPDNDTTKFRVYGMAATQYATARDLIDPFVYQGSKGGVLFPQAVQNDYVAGTKFCYSPTNL